MGQSSGMSIVSFGGGNNPVQPGPYPAQTTQTTPTTQKTHNIEVESQGGELNSPSQQQLLDAGVAPGSTVTVSITEIRETTPSGQVIVHETPSETEVQQIEKDVATLNQDVEDYNKKVAEYGANPTDLAYAALVADQQKLEDRAAAVGGQAGWANIMIDQANQHQENRPEPEPPEPPPKPKGLAQSLWWGATPWKEEEHQSFGSYVGERGVLAALGGTIRSVGMVAAPGVAIAGLSVVAPPLGIAAAATLGGYMAYQTQKTWSGMSNAERAFNVGMVALCFLPAAGAASRVFRRASIGEYRVTGRQLARAEARASGNMRDAISWNYGKGVGRQYGAMTNAQARLLDTYVKIETLTAQKGFNAKLQAKLGARLPTRLKGRFSVDAEIARLKTRANVQELDLQVKARGFSDTLLRKAGFDSPRAVSGELPRLRTAAELRRMSTEELAVYSKGRVDWPEVTTGRMIMENLADDIVRNTRSAAKGITGGTDLKGLKLAADRATATLQKAQARYGKDSSKWSDLMYDAAVKQSQYDVAKLGSPTKLLSELTEVRSALESGHLKNGKPLNSTQLAKLKIIEANLSERYAQSIYGTGTGKLLEAIYDSEGKIKGYKVPEEIHGGKGGGVAVKPKTSLGGGGGGTTKPRLSTTPIVAVSGAGGVGVRLLPAEVYTKIVTEINLPASPPKVREKIETTVQQIVDTALIEATEVVTTTSTDEEVKTIIEDVIEDVVGTVTDTEVTPLIKARVATLTKVIQKAFEARFLNKKKKRWAFMLPKLSKDNKVGLSAKDLAGATSFKQGFMYWTVLKDRRRIPTLKPIKGVPVLTGRGSPQKSIVSLGKGIDGSEKIDMGVSTAHIYDPPGKGKPRLTYTSRRKPKRKPGRASRPRLSR